MPIRLFRATVAGGRGGGAPTGAPGGRERARDPVLGSEHAEDRRSGTDSHLLLAACTSTVVGSASPAEAPAPPPAPAPPAGPAEAGPAVAPPPLTPGTQVEAIRMAAATSLVTTASPDRTEYCNPSGPFVDAATLEDVAFAPGTAVAALREHGFVAAWAECGRDSADRATPAITMEVSDPQSASNAAVALVAPFLLQRRYVGFGSFLAGIDVAGVPALDDTSVIDPLLVAQRDLIDG